MATPPSELIHALVLGEMPPTVAASALKSSTFPELGKHFVLMRVKKGTRSIYLRLRRRLLKLTKKRFVK
jgi:hypothetical protein